MPGNPMPRAIRLIVHPSESSSNPGESESFRGLIGRQRPLARALLGVVRQASSRWSARTAAGPGRIARTVCDPGLGSGMANPPTPSERLFEAYLDAHGFVFEHDLDWRVRFGVDAYTNPDYLVGRALEDLAICEAKERTSTAVDRHLAEHPFGTFNSETVYSPVARTVRDAAEQLAPFSSVGLPLVAVLANPRHLFVPLGADEMAKIVAGVDELGRCPATTR